MKMRLFRPCTHLALTVALSAVSFSVSAQNAHSVEKACVQNLSYPESLRSRFESWATDSTFFSGTAEAECRLTEQLVGLFDYLQEQIATEPPMKRPLRGTHSKGICLTGSYQTELATSLSESEKAILQKAGLFSTSEPAQAQFRFANASSRINPDWKADVRALSFRISLPNGTQQDFAFNNVPRFQIDSLDHFVRVMEMQKGILSGQIRVDPKTGAPSLKDLFLYFNSLYDPVSAGRYLLALKDIKEMAATDSKWYERYTNQSYWSTTAFSLSPHTDRLDQIVKFGAIPCESSQSGKAQTLHTSQLKNAELKSENEAKAFAASLLQSGAIAHDEDYLSESLAAQVAQAPVCYKLIVQFLSEEEGNQKSPSSDYNRKLVEDPSVAWHGPVHVVGHMTMNQTVSEHECDGAKSGVNVTSHSPGIYGLGQINRARVFAETQSRQNRLGH